MEILNNIEWFFYADEIKNAKIRDTGKKITKKQLKTIVFDGSEKTIQFYFPLNDDFSYTETIEITCPINVEQVLQMVKDFYNKPLTQETIDKAFGANEDMKDEWVEDMMDEFDGDLTKLNNYHLFDASSATPDFCGIEENEQGYFISIGPE